MKYKFLKVLLVFIIIIVFSFLLIVILANKYIPIYYNYSEEELKRVIIAVINKSVSEVEIDNKLFILNKEDNNIVIVDYDPLVVNRIMAHISDKVYTTLKLVAKMDSDVLVKYNIDKSIFYIPSGIVFNSPFLNNLGPRIPIKMELIGSINPTIETKVTEYGINNSLREVNIQISASIRMILPLSSKEINVIVVVPLTVKIIQGNIPDYYIGTGNEKRSS